MRVAQPSRLKTRVRAPPSLPPSLSTRNSTMQPFHAPNLDRVFIGRPGYLTIVFHLRRTTTVKPSLSRRTSKVSHSKRGRRSWTKLQHTLKSFWKIRANFGKFLTILVNANLSVGKLPLNIPILFQCELHILFVKSLFQSCFRNKEILGFLLFAGFYIQILVLFTSPCASSNMFNQSTFVFHCHNQTYPD